ncbi:hypothetical protein [Hyalangium sp.]|uniref:hypothetical protein n=1 Tax=Hyalangium sp. TaxID=2028555 RepID=UPI002D6F8502|nr:hypothetical protein [Hyalangium sp.]HYH97202.1 hypothetical protein [Hyalangium sp.]
MSEQSAERIPRTMTLEQAHDSILQSLMQGTAGHYRIGQLYNHIVAHRLAVNRGYGTTREYFRRHVRVLSHATLTMYGAVEHHFRLPVCEKYGMASLGALLEYLRLACIHIWNVDTDEPGPTPIQIPRRGGLQLTKPFSDCTAEDLRQAVRGARSWPGKGTRERDEERVERYLEMVKRHFAQHARFRPEVLGHVHNLRFHLQIRHLRLVDLERLTEVLRRTLEPSEKVVGA